MTICIRTLLASAALVPVLSASLATTTCAQSARAFDVAPGSLETALIVFANQGQVQLLYSADLVAGRRTQGVRGTYGPSDALGRLLNQSGLTASESRPGVFVLRPAGVSGLADMDDYNVEDVVVTGTLIRGPGESPSPVVVISRDELDRQGYGTAAEALTRLPQSYAGTATPGSQLAFNDSAGSNTALATGVNLRGLGEDSTLVLVNGRRLASTGSRGEFSDLSVLPGAALERIDVLLDGASALYGSDAVGGVVNVILRRPFDGQETRVRAASARGGAEDVIVSHLLSRRWTGGGILASLEYQNSSSLNAGDRAYTATGDLRPRGGSDYRGIYGAPANLVRFDAPTGTYVPIFAIRPGADGVARTPADFAAGQANLYNRRVGLDLLPDQERVTGYLSARQNLTDRIEVSADARYSRRDYRYASLSSSGIFTVTAANPFFVSPNGSTSHIITYDFGSEVGNTRREGVAESVGVTAGLDVRLPRDWNFAAYAAWAEEDNTGGQYGHVNATFLNEALGTTVDNPATAYSAARDGFLNLFGSGRANTPAVLSFITRGFDWDHNLSRTWSGNALVDGVLFRLPGGDLKLAAGANYRHEDFVRESISFRSGLSPVLNVGTPRDRGIYAAFAEARIPLFGDANARPGLRRLEVSLAARFEDYSDFGTTTNPKVGIIWEPVEGFKTRASWGTSFRAPALTELYERTQIGAASLASPTGAQLAILNLGGNPDLSPETAETLSVGFDLTRSSGFRFSASYFDILFEDRIGRPAATNLTTALSTPSLAPFLTYVNPADPADLALIQSFITHPAYLQPGQFPATSFRVILDGRWANTGELRTRGLDISTGYVREIGSHRFDLDLAATYLLEYSRLQTPAASREELADLVGFPTDLKIRASAIWFVGDWSTRLGGNYVDNYRTARGTDIGSWLTLDGQLRWTPERIFGQGGVEAAFNVQNLFDEAPPFYDNPQGLGFDPANATLLGRVVSLQLIKRW